MDKFCRLEKEAGLQITLKQSAEGTVTLTEARKTTIGRIVKEVEAPPNREVPDIDRVAKKE